MYIKEKFIRNSAGLATIIKATLSSRYFYYAVLTLVVLQGIWFILSVEPALFDEKHHFDFINKYTEQISPFIAEQTRDWDFLGPAFRNPNYFFYYLMSWPLRVIIFFTESYFAQVFILRLKFLSASVVGIIGYRKLLIRLGASMALANLTFLLLLLAPVAATFMAAISYDIIIFALLPLLLHLGLDLLEKGKLSFLKLWGFISLSMFMILIKFTSMALVVPVVLYVLINLWRNRGRALFGEAATNYKKLPLGLKITTVTVLAVLTGLVVERPVYNIIQYQRPGVGCTKVLPEERCMKHYTSARSIIASRNKPDDFTPLNPLSYFNNLWLPGLIDTQVRIAPGPVAPLLKLLYYFATFAAVLLVLLYFREFWENKSLRLLFIMSGVYAFVLFADLYRAYVLRGQPIAISSRYLLPILPLFIYLALEALKRMVWRRYPTQLALLLVLTLVVLATQGGGIATHLVTNPDDYWWGNGWMNSTVNPVLEESSKQIIIDPRGLL